MTAIERVAHPRRTDLIAIGLVAMAVVAFWGDLTLAKNYSPEQFPGELRILLNKAEPFGHGYGVALILVTVYVLTRCEFRKLWTIAWCGFGAGLFANLIKLSISRTRPNAIAEEATHSFGNFLPMLSDSSAVIESAGQSFPSAHTATAVGLAVALAAYFPQGRAWFYSLAGLVALQRVVHLDHFPSDVLVGAAIGLVVGTRMILWSPSSAERTRSSLRTISETEEERDEPPSQKADPGQRLAA